MTDPQEGSKPAQQQGGNKNKRKNKRRTAPPSGKNSKKPHNMHTWQSNSKTERHLGSYATPEQQERFSLTVPTFTEDDQESEKRQKRKVALLLGYLGTGYSGFQINAEQRTLQAELELALYKGRFITPDNFGFPNKISWSTSGRTDKGVHAASQVISAKIEILPSQTMDDVRQVINEHLPPSFRVLDVVRTTRSFCAKTQRDQVRYQYLIPSFCLAENMHEILVHAGVTGRQDRDPRHPLTPEEMASLQSTLLSYRVTEAQKQLLKDSLQSYVGTHSFHNYSKGVKPSEGRAARYILSFDVEEPVVVDGQEWIPTQVLGQSFLLHQIRKMICMAIEVTRGVVSLDILRLALEKDAAIGVSLAPAQGLYMEMSYYNGYNNRKPSDLTDVPDISWHVEGTEVNERWKEFRNGTIMPHIVSEEKKEGNFIKFLVLQEYFFDRDSYDPEKPRFNIQNSNRPGQDDDEDEEDDDE